MTDNDAALAANLEFYRAFTAHDWLAMDRLWAKKHPVMCLHPGWTLLRGREAVMQSWRDILTGSEAPHVMCHDDEAFVNGDVAIVVCEEELRDGSLAATNLFVREEGNWRMMHHQASPIIARYADGRR